MGTWGSVGDSLLYQTHFSERSRSVRTHWSKSGTIGSSSVGDTSPFTVILSKYVLLSVRSANPVKVSAQLYRQVLCELN